MSNPKSAGDAAEDQALAFLQSHGLVLHSRNFKSPGRGGGEIDLIMREISPCGELCLVFVEVRKRKNQLFGGAAASVNQTKRQRIVYAARHFLRAWNPLPNCRFDVLAVEDSGIQWFVAAFDASFS